MKVDAKVVTRWRAIDIQVDWPPEYRRSWRQRLAILWGSDIWVWNVPVLKTLVAANVVVWVIGWVLR